MEDKVVINDAVCPFCACLCDDIVVVVDKNANKITEILNACELGVRKFLAANRFVSDLKDVKSGNRGSEASAGSDGSSGNAGISVSEGVSRVEKPRVRGGEVEYEDALEEAVNILKSAKRPLVYGLSNTGYNAQRLTLEIARAKSGIIENSEAVCHNLFYQAVLRRLRNRKDLSSQSDGSGNASVGGTVNGAGRLYFATLDQIRDKAHLIIYWGADPIASHPRHLSKFSFYPVGLYTMKGSQDRELIVIDSVETPLKKIASIFLRVPCGEDWKVAEIMRKIVCGDTKGIKELAKGLDFATISAIADKMKCTSFGVIFVGLGVLASAVSEDGEGDFKCIDALLSLVEALNDAGARFVVFPMKGHFNVVGAVTLMMRETGYPFSVEFHRSGGRARGRDGEHETGEFGDSEDVRSGQEHAEARFMPGAGLRALERGDADAALIVGADPLSSLPKRYARALLKIPTIVIDPFESITAHFATVFLPSAITGVESEDIAYRMDGLPLKLKKIVECPLKSDAEILQDILNKLK